MVIPLPKKLRSKNHAFKRIGRSVRVYFTRLTWLRDGIYGGYVYIYIYIHRILYTVHIYIHRILYTVYIHNLYIVFIYIYIYNMYVLLRTDISWYVYSYNMDKSTNTDLAMAPHGAVQAPSWRPLQYPPPSPRDDWWNLCFFHWKIGENTGNHWKLWGKYGKFIGNYGNIWEIHRNIWENMGKSQKIMGRSCQTHGKII